MAAKRHSLLSSFRLRPQLSAHAVAARAMANKALPVRKDQLVPKALPVPLVLLDQPVQLVPLALPGL